MQRYFSFRFIKNQYKLRVSYELQIYVLKSLRDLLFLAMEFFIENTSVQVISSVKHDRTPLRDLAYEYLKKITSRKQICMGIKLSVENLAIIWVFFCFLNGSKGLTIVQKGARCLIIARTLRIFLFSMTILPSPKPFCNFTDPINPFKVLVGGACNDLLYSGHVTIYTLTAISFTILSRQYSSRILRYGLPILIWFHIIQRIICTILERHHYSIDMFLGFIVTSLIWECKPLHIDLPVVPQNLFLHLKQLVFPKYRLTVKEV
ncbi:unnamed protein product [Rotaria sordida]|uniref:Sphingomyelin synthase-like domain-containing protein n=1 Tax=Rotaria sordida TaxID=392033 RepID=A0A818WQE8_9BILA|nr:unnamed protein product [Rotaria sordida]CAF3729260.1 unnamed protein product [Rotaria sordida]